MKEQEIQQNEAPFIVGESTETKVNETGANDQEKSSVAAEENEPEFKELESNADQIPFQRKQIGPQDTKKKEAIHKIYDNLVDTANQAKFELEKLIDEESMSELSLDLIIEFLKSNNPETWLIQKYIQAKGMKVEFLKTEKLIESGLFDLPDYSGILAIRSEFHLWKKRLREHSFVYPFRKLFIADDNVFILTPDFEVELKEATTVYTQNKAQNEVLEALEGIMNGLNTINRMGVLNIRSAGLPLSDPLSIIFDLVRTNHEDPVAIYPKAFRTKPLRRFSEEPSFGNQKSVDFWD